MGPTRVIQQISAKNEPRPPIAGFVPFILGDLHALPPANTLSSVAVLAVSH